MTNNNKLDHNYEHDSHGPLVITKMTMTMTMTMITNMIMPTSNYPNHDNDRDYLAHVDLTGDVVEVDGDRAADVKMNALYTDDRPP